METVYLMTENVAFIIMNIHAVEIPHASYQNFCKFSEGNAKSEKSVFDKYFTIDEELMGSIFIKKILILFNSRKEKDVHRAKVNRRKARKKINAQWTVAGRIHNL